MTIWELIQDLGGPSAVARELNLTPAAPAYWSRNNVIPLKQWRGVLELCAALKYPMTAEKLLAMHGF